MSDFQLDVRNLNTSTLNALFSELYESVIVKDFTTASRAACGDGVASTADRINLSVSYQKNKAQLPEKIILKTLLLNPFVRLGLPAILSLSSAVSVMEKAPFIGDYTGLLLFIFGVARSSSCIYLGFGYRLANYTSGKLWRRNYRSKY
jgi:hypothetical protein